MTLPKFFPFTAVVVFCLASVAAAQQDQTPAPTQAVLAGKLIDVRTGKARQRAYILIAGDRIQSIADSAPVGIPITDLSAYTVLPGLIDAHAHTLSNPTTQSIAAEVRTSIPQSTIWGVYNLRLWLDHGFTSLRDACEGPADYPQFALRESVKRGIILGPRITAAGSCVSLTGGHGDGTPFSPDMELPRRPNVADTVDDIAHVVRRDIKYGADWIKLMASGGVMDPISDFHVQELSEAQMAAAVEIAHRAGKKVMAHAEGAAGIKAAVRAGLERRRPHRLTAAGRPWLLRDDEDVGRRRYKSSGRSIRVVGNAVGTARARATARTAY